MRFLPILIITFVFSPLNPSETRFIYWWTNYDENVLVDGQQPGSYLKVSTLSFSALAQYRGAVSPPPDIAPKVGKVLIIFAKPNRMLLLATPRNILKSRVNFDQEYVLTQKRCRADTSWLVSLPENTWSEIDLNPYCNMDYDEDGISINLYWAVRSTKPYVDIRTNALRCVPHHLYGWDAREKRYVLRARKCTGMRVVEDYAAGTKMEQLFPPLVKP